ncbi:hypothetical protein EJB05_12590, partial [Eragrostis curvula]
MSNPGRRPSMLSTIPMSSQGSAAAARVVVESVQHQQLPRVQRRHASARERGNNGGKAEPGDDVRRWTRGRDGVDSAKPNPRDKRTTRARVRPRRAPPLYVDPSPLLCILHACHFAPRLVRSALIPGTVSHRPKNLATTMASSQLALLLLVALAGATTTTMPVSGAVDDGVIRQVTDGGFRAGRRSPGLLPEAQFAAFVRRHGRRYSGPEEYAARLRVFAANLARAAAHQALDPTARHGVTPFSDLTREEFEARLTGLHASKDGVGLQGMPAEAPAMAEEVARLPASFDWREKGAVTGVKMQGACGSCWAFSTTGAVEGANFLATGKLLDLSEQQLVDCDHTCGGAAEMKGCNNGCAGGLMTNAYTYLMRAGGLMEQAAYPYTGAPGPCRFDRAKAAVRVANFTAVPAAADEAQIRAALVRRGPLAVGLNAAFMQTYVGGVSCPLVCPRAFLNHGVLLVGYGARGFAALRLGYRPYWIIKNSWGEKWGEKGYYRLCRGRNICGVDSMVSAVAVATPP